MVVVPDFLGGAMENYDLITYREVELLHDDLHSAAANTQRVGHVYILRYGQDINILRNAINKTYNSISDLWKEIVQLKKSLVKAEKYAAEAQVALDELKEALLAQAIKENKKYPGSFSRSLSRVQVSTMPVKDDLIVVGGFHGELICKYLNKPGVSFAIKIATDETAITNSVDISYSSSSAMRLMTANNDILIRMFDVKSFTCVDNFSFPWCVNMADLDIADTVPTFNIDNFLDMLFFAIIAANLVKMVLPPMFGPVNFVTTDKTWRYLNEVCLPSVVHRNLKSVNILLDEELNPYLSDCGLATLMRNTEREVATQLVGSFGYSAPEFALSGIYIVKSDVHSFGVVILTGRKPLDRSTVLSCIDMKHEIVEDCWTVFELDHDQLYPRET
nr:uncharacterized WD repeat-containing protein C2A9.03-like isoform X4 [Tanacetum cinerariifolium]